jgi:molybdopterin adenylyltransferase
MKGSIASINISATKGESKTPLQGKVELRPGWGIVGDVHAGTPGRDVSLLPREALGGVPYGGYGENIDTAGLDILGLSEGTILSIGDRIRLQITQHGKSCPSPCSIYYQLGHCIMQDKGVFAAVLEGGEVIVGDDIEVTDAPSSTEDIGWIEG